jgi:transposase
MSKSITHVAGVDVGKEKLSVCLLPDGERFEVSNDQAGISQLVKRCREAGIQRAVMEATSIYHKACSQALSKAGIEVAVLQPRQVKAFAMLNLQWAKTDEIDAELLAKLGLILDAVAPLPTAKIEGLAEQLTYLEQLDELAAWLKTTRERFRSKAILKELDGNIKRCGKQQKAMLGKLVKEIEADKDLASRMALLLSIPAIAKRTAVSLIVRMPELGSITREQAASLAGLAPMNDDTAGRKGERHIRGGRAKVRKALYMAAFAGAMQWNPILKRYFQKRRAKGLDHTPAVVACARKLLEIANAVLKRGTPWEEREVMP